MDVNALTTLIGSLGFPIVSCIALFWYMTKIESQHKEEIKKLSEAINNNTNVITQLIFKLDQDDRR